MIPNKFNTVTIQRFIYFGNLLRYVVLPLFVQNVRDSFILGIFLDIRLAFVCTERLECIGPTMAVS